MGLVTDVLQQLSSEAHETTATSKGEPSPPNIKAVFREAVTPTIVTAGHGPAGFDRERVVLYVAASLAVALVSAFYIAGYLVPSFIFAKSIVAGANADKRFSAGCFLLFMEHANRLQSAYALRFLGMLIGVAVAFVGMVFTIKGLEAGYSLDIGSSAGTASLKTASPGLVLCTMGVALVAAAVLHTSEISFQNFSQCF
jgi:hypothetical protein